MAMFGLSPLEIEAGNEYAAAHPYIPPIEGGLYQFIPQDIFVWFLFIVAWLSAAAAFFLNKSKFRIISSDYRWGFFQCVTTFFWTSFTICWFLILRSDQRYLITDGVLWTTWSITLSLAAFLAFRQTRIGWIVFTVLSANPLFWVVNFIYGKNRWHELKRGFNCPRLNNKPVSNNRAGHY